ncbi:hypothetical protein K440DRAFT_44539 [Wilcoxina mikolae CBS 423.85]|nr:hypothetical protein K440DRAFT_44539 [Wilcoxina mikolae CBS 423.85]
MYQEYSMWVLKYLLGGYLSTLYLRWVVIFRCSYRCSAEERVWMKVTTSQHTQSNPSLQRGGWYASYRLHQLLWARLCAKDDLPSLPSWILSCPLELVSPDISALIFTTIHRAHALFSPF